MNTPFFPIKWYYPTGASGPVPCEWSGWFNGNYITIYLAEIS